MTKANTQGVKFNTLELVRLVYGLSRENEEIQIKIIRDFLGIKFADKDTKKAITLMFFKKFENTTHIIYEKLVNKTDERYKELVKEIWSKRDEDKKSIGNISKLIDKLPKRDIYIEPLTSEEQGELLTRFLAVRIRSAC